MRVSKLYVKDFMGIAEMEVDLGKVTEVSGDNGQGKSSLVQAIASVVQGGSDARLVRNGADSGEVVILIDDGHQIRKRIAERSRPTVKDANGSTVPSPQSFIQEVLGSELSANPVKLLNASTSEKRKEWMVKAMPLTVTKEQIELATGLEYDGDVNGHALEVIRKFDADIREERRKVNVAADTKRKSEREWNEALGPEPPAGETAAALQTELDALSKEYVGKRQQVAEKLESDANKARERYRSEAQTEIDKRREQIRVLQQEIADFETKRAERLGNLDRQLEQAKQFELVELDKGYQPRLQGIRDRLAAAHERDKGAAARQRQQQLIAQTRTEAEKLEAESAEYTKAIEGLDKLRNELMAKAPLKGVEVRDDDVYVDGVPWDLVNTAKRVQVALKAAAKMAGKAKLIVVDDIESLAPKAFEAFLESAKKSPYQFIFTRVTDGPLKAEKVA